MCSSNSGACTTIPGGNWRMLDEVGTGPDDADDLHVHTRFYAIVCLV
jgi:hypothetical protein